MDNGLLALVLENDRDSNSICATYLILLNSAGWQLKLLENQSILMQKCEYIAGIAELIVSFFPKTIKFVLFSYYEDYHAMYLKGMHFYIFILFYYFK